MLRLTSKPNSIVGSVAACFPGWTAYIGSMNDVDLALVLALDGSASVGFEEFALIVDGCAAALRDPDVMPGLLEGPRRGSLVCALLWSGRDARSLMAPWTRVTSARDLDDFAATVGNAPRDVRPGTTALGAALAACETLLAEAPAKARRRIIDVAGDGRSNDGPPPRQIRDRLVATGVMINGLCVLHEEADLLETYLAEVVGGPDAFALPCADFAGFAEAMRRKLLRETSLAMAGATNPGF